VCRWRNSPGDFLIGSSNAPSFAIPVMGFHFAGRAFPLSSASYTVPAYQTRSLDFVAWA
jgi:hypothetical protein